VHAVGRDYEVHINSDFVGATRNPILFHIGCK
jgi:hypothetical protein